jgi:eukaryotic-like serine/threonine-protein kinase
VSAILQRLSTTNRRRCTSFSYNLAGSPQMTLSAGVRIGPYEIHTPLGAGGMGEVYRARDTKLGREVAIKILPDGFADDPERVSRFEREAQLLASLNHPSIAQIYGFDDTGDVRALVMELVDGPTLADRIASGPIPLDEALPIGRQIAEALEAAHEHGIIHRDLKPANIKVRPDGTVKVLDFGLAKLAGPAEAGHSGRGLTALPTITSPAMMTGAGMVLGTAAYMAPEQARGKDVDKRADIWAFGCVLYEMLTGRRVFDASEVSDTLAMVLMKEVDWSPLPSSTPSSIRTLLRRCLEKDRKRRLPDSGVARLEIEDALSAPASPTELVRKPPTSRSQRVAWALAALATIAAIALGAWHFLEPSPVPAASIRFSVVPPADMFQAGEAHWLSPDGRHLAFRVTPRTRAAGPPAVKLAIRTFDQPDARILPGTEGVANAFWSPDSRFLAFFANGRLQKVDLTGGPPQVIAETPFQGAGTGTGGTWSRDGTIVFSIGAFGAGLFRVSAGGGTPVSLTKPAPDKKETERHAFPRFLPDGRHFLFASTGGQGGSFAMNSILVGSVDGEPPKTLVRSDTAPIYADGFLLFVREATLIAQRFDVDRLEVTGDPVVVAQDVATNLGMAFGGFSVSETGTLSYRTVSEGGVTSQLVWFDRSGKRLGAIGDSIDQAEVQLSPDGTRAAVSVFDPTRRTRDIWIYDLTRDGLRTRFTFDDGEDWSVVWSPDSRRLMFSGGRPNPLDLYERNADGSGTERRVIEAAEGSAGLNKYVRSWSMDGRFVLFNTGAAGSQTGNDLWMLPLADERKPRPLVQTAFVERSGRFSPDGRWVAYQSNESGRGEIYVIPFASEGGKWQISTAGGDDPKWRRDGRELFYVSGNRLMAAEVSANGTAFRVGSVRPLFEARFRTQPYLAFGPGSVFDVTADGQRFLANVTADTEQAPPPITVITNWMATLK